ncbi:G patch domain-containing protein 11 [Parasteatoda tepidariorum]|uniref:G patch domain-containing protein 11 n=1 Tax=Parasteatoda tepidariorum TaxID=114398 RepID=UPI00077F9475|nr:G patch domain-containing protein 11 [Parasteatoda tepidariorum]XP_015912283.1 G patch domain-containing protein 11 [Parasteatoda tepidariorum]XP_015912291.1 G patch domain-containing protein 11 [Parasteatoda tepidariorum]
MSDDEDDYMSASFLNVKEDIRPGLAFCKSTKRKLEIEKKQTASNEFHKTKSRKQLEEESRNTGMDSAISSNNKGFAMLQKMGYKPGMKLGPQKDTASDRGLMEPIRINIKKDRGGLGRDEEVKKHIERIKERREKLKVYKEKETEILTKEFRQRMRDARTYKRLMKDLHKCQKICEQLDKENDIKEPSRSWFWYTWEEDEELDEECDEQEEEDEEDDLSAEEKVEIITEYLRPTYFYCFWCSIKYNDFDDLEQNCPGPDKTDHDDLSS